MSSKYFNLIITISLICFMCDKTPQNIDTPATVIDQKPDIRAQTDYIFKEDTIRTYEILMIQVNLDSIDNDPVAEQYVEGKFVIENDTNRSRRYSLQGE